jgi:hypothetical protein
MEKINEQNQKNNQDPEVKQKEVIPEWKDNEIDFSFVKLIINRDENKNVVLEIRFAPSIATGWGENSTSDHKMKAMKVFVDIMNEFIKKVIYVGTRYEKEKVVIVSPDMVNKVVSSQLGNFTKLRNINKNK